LAAEVNSARGYSLAAVNLTVGWRIWPRGDHNAQRSDAGWGRREINCTAGWSSAGRSWRWQCRSLAIRRYTDERRAQTRVASARVRVLHELRTDQNFCGEIL